MLPRIDWSELLGVSCDRFLGSWLSEEEIKEGGKR
jgi:hypothetical protein